MDPLTWQDVGTMVLGIAGVVGTLLASLIAGRYQARVTREQVEKSHESQLALLREGQLREDRLRNRQYEEADRADRLLVTEYIDLLLPRLCQITSIYFLAGDSNKNEDERRLFLQLQQFMRKDDVNPAHPERNLGLRLTFLLFQLVGSLRLALNARWTRPISDAQTRFLAHWEDHIEPLICSRRYPGDELLYREQLEIIADEMLNTQPQAGVKRPMNWKEFCSVYTSGGVLAQLANIVAEKLRFIFEDGNPKTTPLRRSMQCRLAMLALYLIRMSEECGNKGWSWRSEDVWRTVVNWFAWEASHNQSPEWWVFDFGDVANRYAALQAKVIAPSPPAAVTAPSSHWPVSTPGVTKTT